jgi:hypothetical protein
MDTLAARKALLIARLRLQRIELALHVGAARATLRPASLVASAIAKPATLVAVFEAVSPLLGLKRYAPLGAYCFDRIRRLTHRAHAPQRREPVTTCRASFSPFRTTIRRL